MKSKVGVLALLLIISAVFSECKKEDQISPSNTIINTIVMPGDWRVSKLVKHSADETNQLKSYVFKLNTNGTIVAVKNGVAVNGAWSTARDGDHLKLTIYFSGAPLNELNNDWRVMNQTNTTIELQYFRGENDGIDFLTFQQN